MSNPAIPTPSARATTLICGGLILLFALLSYWAVLGKSATYDEPLHAVAGHMVRFYDDYRVDPEDGALFTWWSSLFHSRHDLKINLKNEYLQKVVNEHGMQWPFVVGELFQTSGVDGDAYLDRSRLAFVPIGMALAALIGWWAWKLGGAIAAIAASVLFCLDPNFLAHTSLVKNDVALSLFMLWLMLAVWMFGQHATLPRLVAICVACGAALNVKFSGLLFGPMVAIALSVRALLPQPWSVLKWRLSTRLARLGVAIGVCVIAAIFSYVSIWAVYSFRFEPAPDRSKFNVGTTITLAKVNELRAGDINAQLTQKIVDEHKPKLIVQAVEYAEKHRLLPQAWLQGLVYTYATTLIRSSFIAGQYSVTGWWYFFPLTMLFKTPVTTIVVGLVAVGASIFAFAKPPPAKGARSAIDWWTLTCLVIPVAIYGGSALLTNLNLGLRHILPVYPFIYIAIALAVAHVMHLRPSLGKWVGGALVVGLLFEAAVATPNYLAYVNFLAGGSRGGIKVVGDSSLDWGQDLKLLAQWQKDHPNEQLYLCYFGTADPASYGIRADYVSPGWPPWGPWTQDMHRPGTLAISATNLQAIYATDEQRKNYQKAFGHVEPKEVLGGTIYLYDWPLQPVIN